MTAFHIDVPRDARSIDIDLQFLSPTAANQGRIVMTPDALRLQWQSMSLYPAGYFTRQIPVEASVRYPEGWTAVSGLPSKLANGRYQYDRTSYDTLVDSPVLAGRYYKAFALSPQVTLDVVADTPEQLAATPEQIAAHKNLVDQSIKLFGTQHYDNYHFLLSISDRLGGIGLEHHRSSEDGVALGYFTDWENSTPSRDLLPHEYTHSWNGKFRRASDLWTPDFRTPMRDSLLWVYEGQTSFWGTVLAARAGIVNRQDSLDSIAVLMAGLADIKGRDWRPLGDTTGDPIFAYSAPKAWQSWQRGKDYYIEGMAVWMEVDGIIRRQTAGTKSIDDFAKAFFAGNDGDWGEVTYDFDDVVAALHKIVPLYDWTQMLEQRLTETGAPPPFAGLIALGYRLTYSDTPTAYFKAAEKQRKRTDLSSSIGLVIGKDGDVTSVTWDSAAFKAGIVVGQTLVSVNGVVFSPQVLKDAIVAAKDGKAPITLIVKQGDRVEQRQVDYHAGLRYPRLAKIGTAETGLDRLLSPR